MDIDAFFCRVGSIVLPLNRKKKASAAFLLYGKQRPASKQKKEGISVLLCHIGKHSSITKQLKEGFGGYFCRIGSVDLVVNKWIFFLYTYMSLLFVPSFQVPWCRNWLWESPSQFCLLGRRLPAICRVHYWQREFSSGWRRRLVSGKIFID